MTLPFQVQFVFHLLFLSESQNFRRHIALPSLIRAFLMLSMSRRSGFPGNIFKPTVPSILGGTYGRPNSDKT